MDRAGGLGSSVAGNPARERELPEELAETRLVAADVRIDLAVGAFQIRVRHESWSTVARSCDIHDVQIVFVNGTVQVDIDEVQPRRRTPVAEQARLDMGQRERLLQQGIVVEINLTDGQIIRCSPIGVHFPEQIRT